MKREYALMIVASILIICFLCTVCGEVPPANPEDLLPSESSDEEQDEQGIESEKSETPKPETENIEDSDETVLKAQRNEKDEESKILNEYIDIPVTYQGSAKSIYVDRMDTSYGDLDRREEDNMQVTYGGYIFFKGDEYKEIAGDYWYGLYDEDFDINLDENKLYVLVYGRKLVKLQYNPSKRSQFGRLANRIVVDWDNDLMKETVFIYECDYDPKEGGGALAEMTMEF